MNALNSSDISLLKAVITQAIIDASNVSDDRMARKLELEAKAWIFGCGFGCGEYFKNIWFRKGMEPTFVIKITKQIIKLHRIKAKNKKSKLINKIPNATDKTVRTKNEGRS